MQDQLPVTPEIQQRLIDKISMFEYSGGNVRPKKITSSDF
jgi:hypothetical protein